MSIVTYSLFVLCSLTSIVTSSSTFCLSFDCKVKHDQVEFHLFLFKYLWSDLVIFTSILNPVLVSYSIHAYSIEPYNIREIWGKNKCVYIMVMLHTSGNCVKLFR